MKLADLIAKKLTNALVSLGILDLPKPVERLTLEEWSNLKQEVDSVVKKHVNKKERKEKC